MSKLSQRVFSTDSSRLAELFTLGTDSKCSTTEDFQESLDHLLRIIPMANAINQLPASAAQKLRERAGVLKVQELCQGKGIVSFGDLIRHPDPPVEGLTFAKDFGKRLTAANDASWPPEVGMALYYLAIGTALLRAKERISALSTDELSRGLSKVARFEWLDDSSRKALEEAQAELATKSEPSGARPASKRG